MPKTPHSSLNLSSISGNFSLKHLFDRGGPHALRFVNGDIDHRRSGHGDPQAIATSLAGQALFAYAPDADRARRIVSKLRQVPRLVQAARDNIKETPGIFVKMGLESWRGILKFIDADLPRAFASLDDLHILGDLADTSAEASTAVKGYVDYLENDLAPRAKASFRLGRDKFEKKLRLDEGITFTADRLLSIALRELHEVQEEFRSAAGKASPPPTDCRYRARRLAPCRDGRRHLCRPGLPPPPAPGPPH